MDNPRLLEDLTAALMELPRRNNMLFCVGDGNHSLATAKAIWEEAKETLSIEEQKTIRSAMRCARLSTCATARWNSCPYTA